MKKFDALLETTETLLGPHGCPWDREQTMLSVRDCILEEACELIEAIDFQDKEHIQEELGDLLFVALFLCKLAEKENKCTLQDVLEGINEKLIRRHPHVFGTAEKLHSGHQVMDQWHKIKSNEKGKTQRTELFDGIPKSLPALARGHKMIKKLKKAGLSAPEGSLERQFDDEDSLGELLFKIVKEAQDKGLDSELALKKYLSTIENSYKTPITN